MGRPSTLARVIAFAVSAVYSVILFFLDFDAPLWWRFVLSGLPTVAVGALLLWDLWAWHLKPVRKIIRRPDLRGFWRVSLTPHPDSLIPDGGNWGPIDGFVEIRQSFWSLHVRQYTKESESFSSSSTWVPTPGNEVDAVLFTYNNKPKMSESHRSPPNMGTCSLGPTNMKPREVEGTYFTDRLTKGDLVLTWIDESQGHESYAAALRYVEEKAAAD